MVRPPVVAVVGDSDVAPGDPRAAFAEELGRRLVDRGWRVQTGGLGGVMEAAARGARSSPAWTHGSVVGILPGWDPAAASPYVDVAIPTGLGHGRNQLVVQADAVVAIGGGAGTLSEIALAWLLHRLVVARRGDGWAGRLADQRVDERVRFPEIADDRVFGADSAEEAVRTLEERLPRYRRRTGA